MYAVGQRDIPALQNIAADLAKDDIGHMLLAMKNTSERMEAIAEGRGDASQMASQRIAFETLAKALEARFTTLSGITEKATAQLDRLRKASKASIFEYKARKLPPTGFAEVRANPDAVLSALNAANGSWTWLLSDVKELRRLVEKAQFSGTEALYSQIGLETWKDIARAARGFVTNVPHQQRFLSGDNYYDNCGLVEGRWFAALNAVERGANGGMVSPGLRQGSFGTGPSTGLLLSLDFPPSGRPTPRGFDAGAKLRLDHSFAGVGNPAAASWRLRKITRGWWRITNVSFGETKALDTDRVVALGNYSGQYWRFLPVGNWGACRLVNSYQGDLSSLTAKRRAGSGDPVYDVVMSPTTDGLNQQWLFKDVTAGAR